MRLLTVLALAVLVASPASAAPFTWLVKGTVISDKAAFPVTPYDDAFVVGQTFEWLVTMESTAPDLDASPGCGLYTPIRAMTFTSGSVVRTADTTPSQDAIFVPFNQPSPPGGCFIPTGGARIRTNIGDLFFALYFPAGPTDALIVDPSAIALGPAVYLELTYNGPAGERPPFGGTLVASARVTSITAVPEPLGTTLMLGGLLAVWQRRRSLRPTR